MNLLQLLLLAYACKNNSDNDCSFADFPTHITRLQMLLNKIPTLITGLQMLLNKIPTLITGW